MRPGRPMAVGLIAEPTRPARAVLFGLPGNPVAVMVTFLAFVRPALLRDDGLHAPTPPPPLLRARSVGAIRKKPGRTEYQRGFVERGADGMPAGAHHRQPGLGRAAARWSRPTAWWCCTTTQGNVAAGDEVDVMMFDGVV